MRSRSRSTCASWTTRACSGANVFALNEPDREPAYRAPNDRVLRWAAEAPDRLFPFVRLSLDEDPLGEAERCLALGARGIKLHPRAQAFRVDDPLARGRVRAGRRAPAAGADPRRARSAAGHAARARPRRRAAPQRLADPGARGDRGPGRHRRAGAERREHLLRQLHLVAARPAQPASRWCRPSRSCGPPTSRTASRSRHCSVFVRAARGSGADDALLLGMLGDSARGLLEGRRPERRSAPLAPARVLAPPTRACAPAMYMAAATTLLWMGMPERVGFLGLAEAALAEEGLDGAGRARALHGRAVGAVGRDARPRRAARSRRPRPRVPAAQRRAGGYGARVSEVTLRLNGRDAARHRSRRARPWRSSCASRSA